MTSTDQNKHFQTRHAKETRWALSYHGIKEESQGLLAACSPLLSLCVHVRSNVFVRMCVLKSPPLNEYIQRGTRVFKCQWK